MNEKAAPVTVSIPLRYLAARRYKVAFSIKELVRESNDFSKKWVSGCTPVLIKSEPKKLFMHYRVTCTKTDENGKLVSDPRGHEVRVQFDISKIDIDSNFDNIDVKVSCGCPAFLYWGAQWNAHQLDSLEGVPRPLLQAPTKQLDKRDSYFVCKHIAVVSKRIAPAITNVINRLKDKLKLERIRKNREDEIAAEKAELERLENEKPAPQVVAPPKVKPEPKAKPNRDHLDMGGNKPRRTRPGVLD